MSTVSEDSLFHGGAPGLAPGARLRPASELGLHFTFDEGATYLRDRVYVTRELDSARRFASNYLDRFGSQRPGDVYRVEAKGSLEPDRDYPTFGRSEGVFLMTRSAVVLEVVEREVDLDEAEKWRIDGRHAYWEGTHDPVYDYDGHLTLSPDMRQARVPERWLRILKPWYHPSSLDGRGWFVADDPLAAMFDAVPQLDTAHQIVGRRRALSGRREFLCSECGQRFGREEVRAATHQLGEREAAAIMALFGRQAAVARVIAAAVERNPERWMWAVQP